MEKIAEKYLIFSVSSEKYAVSINTVREIIRHEKITRVRDSQEYLKGVINLRGKIIPIIDMRSKFGIEEREYDDRTVFIIVDINSNTDIYNIGMAVDSVHEVFDVDRDNIQDPPKIGLNQKTQYLNGIARINEEMAMILNIDKILTSNEIISMTEGVA